jgi:hypothetical protein
MTGRWVNRDAVEWVLYEADAAGDQLPVLLVVASFTNAEGRGAYPARSLVAQLARRSLRQVVYDLADLVKQGELVVGDWRLVMHIRADRRPHVYDLPDKYRLWLARGARSAPGDTPRGAQRAPRKASRGAIHDTHGVQSTAERGAQRAPEEFLKNSGRRARDDAQPSAASLAGARNWCGRCASPTRRFEIADSGAVTTTPCHNCSSEEREAS